MGKSNMSFKLLAPGPLLIMILLTGVFISPVLQNKLSYAQVDNYDSITKMIKDISLQVTKSDPDSDRVSIEQLLISLASEFRFTSTLPTDSSHSEKLAYDTMNNILLKTKNYCNGLVSQSLSQISKYMMTSNNDNTSSIVQEIMHANSQINDISQGIVNVGIDLSFPDNTNPSQYIAQIAQTLSNQYDISETSVESMINQLLLQASKKGGPQFVKQYMKGLTNEIVKNPLGPTSYSLLQLTKVSQNDDKTCNLPNILSDFFKGIDKNGIINGDITMPSTVSNNGGGETPSTVSNKGSINPFDIYIKGKPVDASGLPKFIQDLLKKCKDFLEKRGMFDKVEDIKKAYQKCPTWATHGTGYCSVEDRRNIVYNTYNVEFINRGYSSEDASQLANEATTASLNSGLNNFNKAMTDEAVELALGGAAKKIGKAILKKPIKIDDCNCMPDKLINPSEKITINTGKSDNPQWPSDLDADRYLKDEKYRADVDKKLGVPSDKVSGTFENTISEISRKTVLDSGVKIPKNHEVHHVVPWDHPHATEAREMLEQAGIDPRFDIDNLSVLPSDTIKKKSGLAVPNPGLAVPHAFTKSKAYIDYVTERLNTAKELGGSEGVLSELAKIKAELEGLLHSKVDWAKSIKDADKCKSMAQSASVAESIRLSPQDGTNIPPEPQPFATSSPAPINQDLYFLGLAEEEKEKEQKTLDDTNQALSELKKSIVELTVPNEGNSAVSNSQQQGSTETIIIEEPNQEIEVGQNDDGQTLASAQ